jgi:MoaA/NifB/PqqE/SkfB family radical SAM enzyme
MTKEQLKVETWKKLVDDVSHFKPLIAITSTEPLLYDGLIDLLDHCHHRGLRVEVTTNGFLLDQFADLFLKKRLDILSVSIDGPPDIHDKIRGIKGAFEKATEPMRHILERRTGKTPLVHVNYTICDLNFDRLVETLPYIECDQLTFSHLNFVTEEMAKVHNAQCRYRVTPAGLSEVSLEAIDLNVLWDQIQKVKTIDKAYPVTLAPELTRDELEGFYRRPMQFLRGHSSCKAIWSVGQILADGNITGSTRCFDTARLGNIQHQSLTALWNGPILRDFRKYLRRNGGAYPACSRCCGLL